MLYYKLNSNLYTLYNQYILYIKTKFLNHNDVVITK